MKEVGPTKVCTKGERSPVSAALCLVIKEFVASHFFHPAHTNIDRYTLLSTFTPTRAKEHEIPLQRCFHVRGGERRKKCPSQTVVLVLAPDSDLSITKGEEFYGDRKYTTDL